MFWDKVAGIYDLFGNLYNGKVDREMCRIVTENINADDRVLECACGTGMISICIAEKCAELTATDYSDGMLKQTRKKCRRYSNVNVEKADILALAYTDESFDAVVAANVIHLLDEPLQAVNELKRVCMKGGRIIIPTYMDPEDSRKTNGFTAVVGKAGADFKSYFTFSNYPLFFKNAGFEKIEVYKIYGRVPCAVAVLFN